MTLRRRKAGLEAPLFQGLLLRVSDVSQTEGKPLPEFEVPPLTGEANEELFNDVMHLVQAQEVEISFESRPDLDPDIKGMYFAKTIWVRILCHRCSYQFVLVSRR